MRKIYKILLAIIIVSSISFKASAQQNYWSSRSDKNGIVTDKAVARLAYPKEFKLFDLNIDPLRQKLFSIVGNQPSGLSTVISLPNADGGVEQFEVFEASNFDPALQAKYPEIRAFSGRGITDKYAFLKLSISPQGIQTMVFRTDKENEFIEAYSRDHNIYAVYKSQREKGKLPWICSTVDQKLVSDLNAQVSNINKPSSSAGELRTIRLAQSCNGEYSNFFGAFNPGQSALVYAAFNATLTRCNGCYEKDLAIHLNLISNTFEDLIIFYDPATDPYTNLNNWNSQLQNLLNAVVGNANYDIGHMFGASGGGGNAGCIGCVCVDGIKGSGITSPADGIPMGDNFDIDYVVHEVGHQLGGNHSYSFQSEGPGPAQKEVGAGITIMGYAGITSYDPAPHSIDIYHEANIQQIQNNLATKSCPVTITMTANHPPVVAPVNSYTIPISTPFALTGSATDPENDPITYCWEENDNLVAGQTGANSVAYAAKPAGPNWLSFPATASPTRLFPRLSTILAGLNITPPFPGGDAICNIEALSSVSRALNFRLTVRDNHPYIPGSTIGQTQFTDMTVTVTNTSGPFQVTSPNTPVSWFAGSTQTVTWDINNTNAPPVSCSNVNILFSSDGGLTFPVTLASNTPNDGSETITLPGTTTTTARIKIEAVGNIFFDISNTNFTVAVPPSGFSFNSPAPATASCPAPATMGITLGTISNGGFTNPVTLSATAGVPGGTNVTFGTNPVTPGNSSVVTLNNTNTLSFGSYVITITGVASGAPNQTVNLTYTINPGATPTITVQPAPQTVCAGSNAVFNVTASGATSYQWQVSTDGGTNYNNIGGATASTYTAVSVTAGMNNYLYRVIVSGQCGSSTSAAVILTVQTAPAISSQPQSVTLCAGSNNTFSVTATGTNLTYQWQLSTTGCGGPFANIAGATSNSYTINGITAGMDNYAYHCVITGTCTPVATSGCALLTVVTSVTVTTQPSDVTVCETGNASFTVAGSGTGVIYQWQLSTDGGTNYNNITGATGATLNLTAVTASMNGYRYRAILSNATCTTPSTSNAAILTVQTAPVISSHPQSVTLCIGSNNTFSVTATGTNLTYQWQVSTDGGTNYNNIAGATSANYLLSGITAGMSNNRYRCVVSGTCSPAATSNGSVLTVISPVSVLAAGQPVNSEICSGSNTSFTVTGTSTQPITYQWQDSTSAHTWANIAGATSATLSLASVATSMSGNGYRVLLSNTTCTVPTISNKAILTVRQLPAVTLTASSTSLLPGQSATLTATPSASTGGVLTTTWTYNSNPLTVTGNTYVANVEKIGDYRVGIQETWPSTLVCSNQSAIVTIAATVSPKLFIFPSPNDGQFTVAFYNAGGSSTQQTIAVYDSHGAKVYFGKLAITGPYRLHNIDLRPAARGIYYVVLGDANGKTLASGKMIIH